MSALPDGPCAELAAHEPHSWSQTPTRHYRCSGRGCPAAPPAARTNWKQRLASVADALAVAHNTAYELAAAASDAELRALANACQKPTQTNCWWATYHAAPIVLEAVRHEQGVRRKARAAARRASHKDREVPS